MASQWGTTREFSSQDEGTNPRKVQCDKCHVQSVPKGLKTDHRNPSDGGETYCPNCGHVYGRANN